MQCCRLGDVCATAVNGLYCKSIRMEDVVARQTPLRGYGRDVRMKRAEGEDAGSRSLETRLAWSSNSPYEGEAAHPSTRGLALSCMH
jgi:hypothetical protein